MNLQQIEIEVASQIEASPKLSKLSPEDLLSFSVTGLNEEAGEVAGLLCREIYKKVNIDQDRWLEELGDVLWYLAAVSIAKGFTLNQIYQYNETKLKERYGEFYGRS